MSRVSQQYHTAAGPFAKPRTTEQSPLEHLTLDRLRDDRSGSLVEARELSLELIQRRRDVPAFSFPLIATRNRDEVQQLAAPDEIAVHVTALAEGDRRLVQLARKLRRLHQAAPRNESREHRRRRIEQRFANRGADAVGGDHDIGSLFTAIFERELDMA